LGAPGEGRQASLPTRVARPLPTNPPPAPPPLPVCAAQQYCNDNTCNRCLQVTSAATCVYMPCPDNCNGHGLCIHGNCNCTDGWMGHDCMQNATCALAAGCDPHAVCAFDAQGLPHCTCDNGWKGDGISCQP
jgi:hypothetical protein